MKHQNWIVVAVLSLALVVFARAQSAPTVDSILAAYVQAIGGQKALDAITTREAEVHHLTGGTWKLYWKAPDKVVAERGREREGYDGAVGWYETKRKRIQKLLPYRRDEIETLANPLRFARMKTMYQHLGIAPAASLNGVRLDVISAPNSIATTKFFFGHDDHLLHRIEELGVYSAYFKSNTDFDDYQQIDGVFVPLRITRQSDEPGEGTTEFRLSHVKQNIPLPDEFFSKPHIGQVVSGGKH